MILKTFGTYTTQITNSKSKCHITKNKLISKTKQTTSTPTQFIINNRVNKPIGNKIYAPRPNVIAMATRVGPQHSAWFHWIGHPWKPPGRPKRLRSICHTSQLIGDFVQLQILGVRGPKSKIEKQPFVGCHMERWQPKNGSIPSRNKKKRINLKEQHDKQTDAQTESTTKNNRLLAKAWRSKIVAKSFLTCQ